MSILKRQIVSVRSGLLVGILLQGIIGYPGSCAAKPELLVGSIGDPEVATALITGFNLPALVASDSFLAKVSADELTAVVANEEQRLVAILRAYGYFDASMGQRNMPSGILDNPQHDHHATTQELIQSVQLKPTQGPLYRIGSIEIRGVVKSDLSPDVQAEITGLLARYAGAVARANVIDKIESEILWLIRRASYPFVGVKIRQIILDRLTSTVAVQITFDVGQNVRFGTVDFFGLRHMSPNTLSRYVPFKRGDPFDPMKLEALQVNLEKLKIFRAVRVELGGAQVKAGLLPIEVNLREKNPAPEDLAISGFAGLVVTAMTLILLGIMQVAVAGGMSRRLIRPLAFYCFLLVATSGLLAYFRVLNFSVAN